MLNEQDIKNLISENPQVNEGSSIQELVESGKLYLPKGCEVHEGKVTTSVYGPNLITKDGVPIRLMYRNRRISTHDENRGEIPFKDQVLGVNHDLMRGIVREYIGTSQFDIEGLEPTSTVIAAENLDLIPLENVMRQYMAKTTTDTSLYQAWVKAEEEGKSAFTYSGQEFRTNSLSPNGRLEKLLFSPSTKEGRDRTVSPQELINSGIISQEQWNRLEGESQAGFRAAEKYLLDRGIILVDTKTEHGFDRNGVMKSADELCTMDSSRYWLFDRRTGEVLLDDRGDPKSFSKEFGRGLQKGPDGKFSPEQEIEIAKRYIMGLQHLTGEEFKPDLRPRDERIIKSHELILEQLL